MHYGLLIECEDTFGMVNKLELPGELVPFLNLLLSMISSSVSLQGRHA